MRWSATVRSVRMTSEAGQVFDLPLILSTALPLVGREGQIRPVFGVFCLMSNHKLLPSRLRNLSISPREIVLPTDVALEAIDVLESQGAYILGWEGWLKDVEGRHGHGNAPQGWSADTKRHSLHDAAQLCRDTIPADAARWSQENPNTTDVLHICITVRA